MKLSASQYPISYEIVLNGKVSKLTDICLYDDSGVVVETERGYFSDKNGDPILSIDLPVEMIKLRRKKRFDGSVFAMVNKTPGFNYTEYALYIPANMLQIEEKPYFYDNKSFFLYRDYAGDQGISIRKFVKSAGSEKLSKLTSRYNYLHTLIKYFHTTDPAEIDEVIGNLDRMKSIALERKAECERLRNLTASDFE